MLKRIKLFKLFICICMVLGVMVVQPERAFAKNSYTGCDNGIDTAYERTQAAKACFQKTGHSTNYYHYYDNTRSVIQNEIPNVSAVYFLGHGATNAAGFNAQTNKEYVSADDLYSWTRGSYKFVFMDSCYSGDSDAYYKAFNMYSYGGTLLGWNGKTSTSPECTSFTKAVFRGLGNGYTVSGSVWDARVETGITNYKIYGSYDTRLTD